jgi:hypothetical protein
MMCAESGFIVATETILPFSSDPATNVVNSIFKYATTVPMHVFLGSSLAMVGNHEPFIY